MEYNHKNQSNSLVALQDDPSSAFRRDAPFKFMHRDISDPRVYNTVKTVLESVLNEKVHSLTVLNPDLDRKSKDDKFMSTDVLLLMNKKYIVNIEMQNTDLRYDDIDRFLTYDFEILLTKNRKGNRNYKDHLLPVIQIIFVNDMNPYKDRMVLHYKFADIDDGVPLKRSLVEFYIVQIPYVNKLVERKGIENLDENEIHTYLLANGIDNAIMSLHSRILEDMLSMKEEFDRNALLKAMEHNQQRKQYNAEKRAYNEGEEKGRAEGRAEGRQEGHAEGRDEGIYENQKQMVLDFMHIKYPDFDIKQLDDLTLDQYKAIYTCLIHDKDIEEIKAIIR